jgi:murein DD-endopeptidase MepM/ murein hydrolase activator NlpD
MGQVMGKRTYSHRLKAGLVLGVVLGLAACSSARPSPPASAGPPQARPSGTAPSSPTNSAPATPAPASPAPAVPGPAPAGVAGPYLFPVSGSVGYGHTHHDYPATDIIAPCGSPVRAVSGGVVLEVSRVDRYNPAKPQGAFKGGLNVSILGADGVRYYGSHFSEVDAGIEAGIHVRAGTQLGLVGKTGDASVCHLHFGISPPCLRTGDWWTRRGVVWPWPYLDAWRAGSPTSPVAEVTQWQATHGCPAALPPGTR